MGNEYLYGNSHALLKKEDVSADWINGSQGEAGLKATNKAFCIWYNGKKTIYDTGSKEMRESLRECGKSGWGSGVSDLEEAFAHLDDTGGQWTDNTVSSLMYNGKSGAWDASAAGKNIPGDSIPFGVSNFLTAVDKILPKLVAAMSKYQAECQALQQIKLTPTSPKSVLEDVKKRTDQIKTVSKEVSKYAWLAPATVTMMLPATEQGYKTVKSVEEFSTKASAKVNTTLKFADGIDKIDSSLRMYVEASRAFGDEKTGAAFAGLCLALTYVPVLGGFYGEIVKRIPGLAVHWKDFMIDYTTMALRLKPDPPKWKCEICGSM